MKAIILAAGYATRLYPLTKDFPKPLLKIGEKKMVEHIIHKIEEVSEIDDIHLVTNDKFYNHFEEWKDSFSSKKNIILHNDGTKTNEDRLGAVGDLDFVIKKANIDDDVLIVGGDNLFEFSLLNMVELFKQKKSHVVAALDLKDKSKLAQKYGVIEFDDNLKMVGFEEKPENPRTPFASTCVYLFTKEGVRELEKCIKEQNKPDNPGDFIRHLLKNDHVYCYTFSERWFDIGGHEELKEADEYWSSKEANKT